MKKSGGLLILGMSLLIVALSAYPIGAQQGTPGMQDPERPSPQQPGMQQQQPGMQQQDEGQEGMQQRRDDMQQDMQQRQDDMQRGMQQPQDDMQRGMQQPQDGTQQGMQQRQDGMQRGMQQQAERDAPVTIGPSMLSRVQEQLNEQGHDAGPVDGMWGPQTAEGIQSFQMEEGLSPTGNLNSETLQALGIDLSDPQMQQTGDQAGRNGQGAQLHISPPELAQIQQSLKDEGFDVGPVDGMMGPRTRSAIQEYQEARNLEPTGNVDISLIENLGLGQLVAGIFGTGTGVFEGMGLAAEQEQPAGQTGMQAQQDQAQQDQARQDEARQDEARQDEARGYFAEDQADINGQRYLGEGAPLYAGPAVVRQVQETLRETGHDPGEADGAWGPNTEEAVRAYQEEQQLEPTGSLTVATIQQLMDRTGQQDQMQEQQEQPMTREPGRPEEQPGQIDQQPGTVGEQPGTVDQQMDPQRRPGDGTREQPGTTQTPAPGTIETPGGAQQQPGAGQSPETGTGQNQ